MSPRFQRGVGNRPSAPSSKLANRPSLPTCVPVSIAMRACVTFVAELLWFHQRSQRARPFTSGVELTPDAPVRWSAGRPLAHGCLIRRLRNGSAYWGTPAANTRTGQAVGAAESDPLQTSAHEGTIPPGARADCSSPKVNLDDSATVRFNPEADPKSILHHRSRPRLGPPARKSTFA
jgi:hypothetical protein